MLSAGQHVPTRAMLRADACADISLRRYFEQLGRYACVGVKRNTSLPDEFSSLRRNRKLYVPLCPYRHLYCRYARAWWYDTELYPFVVWLVCLSGGIVALNSVTNINCLAEVNQLPVSSTPASRTLTEEAYRRLEEMIVTLELAPGSMVSESILSRKIGIGTTPIREALQRLAREYLVEIIPRRGVAVTSIDIRQQFEVLETRRELDRLLNGAAARRATCAERQMLTGIWDATKAAIADENVREFLRLDAELNQVLSKAARNGIAAEMAATLHTVSRRFWFYHRDETKALAEIGALHTAMIGAIVSGDEKRAAISSDRLIDHLVLFAKNTLPAY